MSSPRNDWSVNVTWMIRNYPNRKREHDALISQNVTADLSGMPHGGGAGRTTEIAATREMAPAKQQEYEAVHKALEITAMLPSGEERIELIRRMYWRGKPVPLAVVAPQLYISERTGWRWHKDFKELVGKHFGYRD